MWSEWGGGGLKGEEKDTACLMIIINVQKDHTLTSVIVVINVIVIISNVTVAFDRHDLLYPLDA